MKKFEFRFQTVLEKQRNEEERFRKQLAHLSHAMETQKQRLAHIDAQKDDCEEELRGLIRRGGNVAQAMLFQVYLGKLSEDMAKQEEVVANVSKKTEEKRQELVEAAKQRQIMEKLLERDRLDFTLRLEKTEQKYLDELALNKYVREGTSTEH